MAQSKPDLFMREEMSLDEWVDVTLAPTYDMVYFISSIIRQVIDSFELDRRY